MLKLSTDIHKASCGLSVTAELLVIFSCDFVLNSSKSLAQHTCDLLWCAGVVMFSGGPMPFHRPVMQQESIDMLVS